MVSIKAKKRFDINMDGKVTEKELKLESEILEIELREEKADTQKRMAWIAMLFMGIFTVALFLPFVPETRVQALSDLLGLFYIAQAGVVGAYMGFSSWMSNTATSRQRYFNQNRYEDVERGGE